MKKVQVTQKQLLATLRALLPADRREGACFREEQLKVIDRILEGNDVLAIMPTGSGKSVCYQIPAMHLPGITLVISPLLALMEDQVTKLQRLGLPVAGLSSAFIAANGKMYRYAPEENGKKRSGPSFRKRRNQLFLDICRDVEHKGCKLLYVTPERLRTGAFIRFAQRADISMIAVDEAHCVSLWGYDFRPRYLEIFRLMRRMGRHPIIAAFTATATDVVQNDILAFLDMRRCQVFGGETAAREELHFSVRRFSSGRGKRSALLQYLRARPGQSGFVYCATVDEVNKTWRYLRGEGIPATRYYAALDQDLGEEREEQEESKEKNFEAFRTGQCPVMVSTTALGMGVDKGDVRFVLHYSLPLCPENYYQEAGRAGRDKEDAECVLFYDQRDVRVCQALIQSTAADSDCSEDERERCLTLAEKRLEWMRRYAEEGPQRTDRELQGQLLDYFQRPSESSESGQQREQTLRRLRSIDVLYVNRTKVAQALRGGRMEGTELKVGWGDPAPTVTYRVTGGTLSYFDLMVADAVYTLMQHRVPTVRAKAVMELLSGNDGLLLRPERRKRVEESIKKMMGVEILIDRSRSAGYGFSYDDPRDKRILGGAFLPLWEKGGGFGYDPGVMPPLYEYAEILNGQFYSFPTEDLRTDALPATDRNLAMTHYLLCRIHMMPSVLNRAAGWKKKGGAMTSPALRFDTMLRALDFRQPDGAWYQRRNAGELWEKMLTILRGFQEKGIIEDFAADPSRRSVKIS